jgi:hypothetical protein
MTGSTHSQGVFSKLLIEPGVAPHTFDASSEIYEYNAESMKRHGRLGGHHGIRGTRSHPKARVRELASYFYGQVVMYISPADWVTLAPKCGFNNQSPSGTFNLTEDTPYFGMLLDRDYGVFEYKDCKVDQWELKGRAPEMGDDGEPDMLTLTLTIIGSDEATNTTWPGTPPALSQDADDAPYAFHDAEGQVTILSSARPITEFVLHGNNFQYARYVNALRPHSVMPRDRFVSFACRTPWIAATEDLYAQTAAGAAGSLKHIIGGMSSLFDFGNLHFPPLSPAAERGKQEIQLILSGFSTATSASTLEVKLVNDNTP